MHLSRRGNEPDQHHGYIRSAAFRGSAASCRQSAAALCVAFVFMRVLYAPFGVCYVICHYYLVSGAGGHVNLAVRLLWCILPVAVTYVSVDFLRNLVNDVIHDTVN